MGYVGAIPPIANVTRIAQWKYFVQFWWAMRERYRALGKEFWPTPNLPQVRGTIEGIADNNDGTLTAYVTATAPGWLTGAGCSPKRWVGYSCPGCYFRIIPPNYDLIIEGDERDPWTCVRGAITDQTGGGSDGASTLVINALAIKNAVTAGFIDSLDYLIDKPWYIIKAGGLWQADKVPDKPNEEEAWNGQCGPASVMQNTLRTWVSGAFTGKTLRVAGTDYTITDNSATQVVIDFQDDALTGSYQIRDGSTLLDSGTIQAFYSAIYQTDYPWPTMGIAGLELLAHTVGGVLYRVHVIGSALHWITFEQQDEGFIGAFSIVAPGTKGIPGRKRWTPFRFYGGVSDLWWTHTPDDVLNVRAMFAATSAIWQEGNPCDSSGAVPCLNYGHECKDIDVAIPIDSLCESARAGDFLAPDYCKTFRALQMFINGTYTPAGTALANAFVPVRSWTGAQAIWNYTPARLFAAMSTCDSGTSTLDNGGFFVVGYKGVNLHWTIVNPDGSSLNSGYDPPNDVGFVSVGPTLPSQLGYQVVWSPGWTRIYPLRWLYLKSKSIFIPDIYVDPETGEARIVDPPDVVPDPDSGIYDCSGKGQWLHRGPSGVYALYDDNGFVYEGGSGPQNGDLAVFVGDDFADPGLHPSRKYDPDDNAAAVARLPYWDRFFRGTYGEILKQRRKLSLAGRAKAWTATSITDTAQSWHVDGVSTGTLRVESGTATDGSGTTLIDDAKNTADPMSPAGCFYRAERFTTGNPYVGFVLRVTKVLGGDDLAFDTSNPLRVASSSHPFVMADVGMMLNVTGGSGWLPGSYVIRNIDTAGGAILDAAPATPAAAGDATWTLNTIYKLPITAIEFLTAGTGAAGSGGVKFTFAAVAGFEVDEDDAYAIIEPAYELNKWRDYKIVLTDPTNGTKYFAKITHSDDTTIWFTDVKNASGGSATFAPADFPGYAIQDPPYGVYRYNASAGEWAVATGADAVRLGVQAAKNFHKDPSQNRAGWVKNWGPMRAGDVITPLLFAQIRQAIGLLQNVPAPQGWTSRYDPEIPEKNYAIIGTPPTYFDATFPSPYNVGPGGQPYARSASEAKTLSWAFAHSFTAGDNDDGSPHMPFNDATEDDNQPPAFGGYYQVQICFDPWDSPRHNDGNLDISVVARYAYPTVLVGSSFGWLPGLQVDYYAYAQIGVGDVPNNVPIETISDDGSTKSVLVNKFDGGSSGLLYHQFQNVGTSSYGGQPVGSKLLGPKVGDTSDASDYPAIVAPTAPPNPDAAVSDVDGRTPNSTTAGSNGYLVSRSQAILRWNMEFI